MPIAAMTLGVGIILPIVPLYLGGHRRRSYGRRVGAFGVGARVRDSCRSPAERRTNDHLLLIAIAAAATSVVLFGLTELAVLLVLHGSSLLPFERRVSRANSSSPAVSRSGSRTCQLGYGRYAPTRRHRPCSVGRSPRR